MQDKDMNFTEISVPAELFAEAGISEDAVLQMYTKDGCIVIEAVDPSDYDCDGDCESCPFYDSECDSDCDNCPCSGECEASEETTLYDFLNSLSDSQQHAALVHLSVLWAEKQGGAENAE